MQADRGDRYLGLPAPGVIDLLPNAAGTQVRIVDHLRGRAHGRAGHVRFGQDLHDLVLRAHPRPLGDHRVDLFDACRAAGRGRVVGVREQILAPEHLGDARPVAIRRGEDGDMAVAGLVNVVRLYRVRRVAVAGAPWHRGGAGRVNPARAPQGD